MLFTIFAILTVTGAVAAMSLRNLVHSVLALTVAFSGLAAVYLLLGAQFVGLAQILVYVGAVANSHCLRHSADAGLWSCPINFGWLMEIVEGQWDCGFRGLRSIGLGNLP